MSSPTKEVRRGWMIWKPKSNFWSAWQHPSRGAAITDYFNHTPANNKDEFLAVEVIVTIEPVLREVFE